MSMPFETALAGRAMEMADACTRCGKCVEACPVTTPAGVTASPQEVIAGVIDIVRTGEGPESARKWASSCVLSGECVKACDYGVNPRFLLAMARMAMVKAKNDAAGQRRLGVNGFRTMSRDVTHISRLQLDNEVLARLGQKADAPEPDETPDFIFYTGCNVLKTPHIALLALDIMDTIGISYRVMGGPSHCCGVHQLRGGDAATLGNIAHSTMAKLAKSKSGQVLSWCPSCYIQFNDVTLPTVEKTAGARPFEMTPFIRFLGEQVDRMRPFLCAPVEMRIALHRHPGVPGVVAAAEKILSAVPGIELVELNQPAVGLQSNSMKALPAYRNELQLRELEAARAAGVDAIVAVYHSDHRELCAHERDWPFQILNLLEIVGASMGLHQPDTFKRLKIMQDADAILADCSDLVARHGLNVDMARQAVQSMLDEQPVPLAGRA